MAPFRLTEEDWNALVEGIARGEYNLLLGAGASAGATGGDGRPLPTAGQLAEELLVDFDLPKGSVPSLQVAFEFIENRHDQTGRSREEYFHHRFTGCTPTWQQTLTFLRWKRIFSLNVDDTIERAFGGGSAPSGQALRTYNWTSPHRDPSRHFEELQLIHLHGTAAGITREDQALVFSILQYLDATSARHAWHRVFGDHFCAEPFVVVGARLRDEYDLADVVRRGSGSRQLVGRPSVVVLGEIPEIDLELFRRWNLIPVAGLAGDFFTELKQEAETLLAPILAGRLPMTSLPRKIRIFLNQFEWLQLGQLELLHDYHDFYAGHDPRWSDIEHDLDARFTMVDEVLERVLAATKTPSQRLVLISGPPCTGKSASLLRIGHDASVHGLDAFLFRGEERLDVDAAEAYLAASPQSLLLFDGMADFALDFDRLAERCAGAKLPLRAVATERENRANYVRRAVAPEVLRPEDFREYEQLSDRDIQRLLEKLEAARRLGRLTSLSPKERLEYFRTECERQLIVAMHGLESATPFQERVEEAYGRGIARPELRTLYALCCMCYSLGYPLPAGLGCALAGVAGTELAASITSGGALYRYLHFTGGRLRPVHRAVASLVMSTVLSGSARYDLALLLARGIAPYVTPTTISSQTIPYRIARTLMDRELMANWVGEQECLSWYEALKDDYDWNARYWEQRALAEAWYGSFPKARSFAEVAILRRRDGFSLTTLGTVLVRMALEYFDVGSAESERVFWEGVHALREARDVAQSRFEHPFVTFFSYSIRRGDELSASGGRGTALLHEWNNWMTKAKIAPCFRQPALSAQLVEYQHQWLSLLAKP